MIDSTGSAEKPPMGSDAPSTEPRRKRVSPCSLVVNVSIADADLVGLTLPHLIATHRSQFAEVIVLADLKRRTGRLNQSTSRAPDELLAILEGVRDEGCSFTLATVDYSESAVERVERAWFGSAHHAIRSAGGTPIYAFTSALELARERFRLHVDCDMLFFDRSGWVQRAIDVLEGHEDVLFVNPMIGPPPAAGAKAQWHAPVDPRTQLRLSTEFSSQCFLFDDDKLKRQLLPMPPRKYPLWKRAAYLARFGRAGSSPYMALEQMIEAELVRLGRFRCDLDRDAGFAVHCPDKGAFLDQRMASTVASVSAGKVPQEQLGLRNLVRPWSDSEPVLAV